MHDHANDGLDHPHVVLGAEHGANERRALAAGALIIDVPAPALRFVSAIDWRRR